MDTHRTDPLRIAVAAGDFRQVLRLWENYAAGVREEIGRGTCTKARIAEAGEFLEWARRVVLCGRAQTQNRLNAVHVASQYGAVSSRPSSLLRTSL